MNQKQQSVILAGLLAFALAGCSSTKGSSDDSGAGATASGGASAAMRGTEGGTGGMATSGAGSMPTQAQTPAPTQAQTPSQMPGDMAAMPAGAPNALVMLIESMPKQGAGAAVGGSGTAGTTGSSMGEDKAYRITLRMDDGTTRVVTQEKAPTYRQGDRVNMQDGVISH
jgi:outer membrane lipoprotein SlyB